MLGGHTGSLGVQPKISTSHFAWLSHGGIRKMRMMRGIWHLQSAQLSGRGAGKLLQDTSHAGGCRLKKPPCPFDRVLPACNKTYREFSYNTELSLACDSIQSTSGRWGAETCATWRGAGEEGRGQHLRPPSVLSQVRKMSELVLNFCSGTGAVWENTLYTWLRPFFQHFVWHWLTAKRTKK